ncbi:MAG: KH domain-containing protein [Oscillospiraceae bacterium]|nr:KH domain-containing protein [Oscillospiraceae bacterium]
MENVLSVIVKGLVIYPEEVRVKSVLDREQGFITYLLHVNERDIGRVIGKHGKIANAIRRVIGAATQSEFGCKVLVETD